MKTMKKPTKERKLQIIDEAINIIHNKGIMALSIRELARKVNITEGAIYKHFKSKDEIIEGIFLKFQQQGKALYELLDNVGYAKEKLRKFIFFHLEIFDNKPEMVSVMFSNELFDLNEDVKKQHSATVKEKQKLLISIIESGIKSGEFKPTDPEIISVMIQGYIRLTLTKWKNSSKNIKLEEEGERFCSVIADLLINN